MIDHPSGVVSSNNAETVLEVGAYLQFHTDFIGPLNPAAFWTVEVWLNADSEHFAMRRKYAFTSSTFRGFQWQPGINDPAQDGEGLGFRITTTAANNATLRVQLDDPTSGFHEQSQRTLQLTLPFDVHTRSVAQTAATGNFTETDRQDLAIVKSSVQVPLPISTAAGAVAQTALGQFISSAPVQLLSRQECRNLTGAGSLTRPSPITNVNALGFSWTFVDIPTFMGRQPGAQLELQQRVVQFVVVQRDFTGVEHVVETIDAHADRQLVTWGLNTPFRIDYSVSPGCVVQFCWLLLLGS